MKKIAYLVLSVIMLTLTTGCGEEKTLNCTLNSNQDGMEMNNKVEVDFKGNEVTEMTITIDTILTEDYVDYKEFFISSFEESFASYKEIEGVDVQTTDNNNIITVTIKADIANMSEEARSEIDLVDTTASYEKTKQEFESEGYTCN